VSFANVVSTTDRRWHLLAGVRWDQGENSALTGATNAAAAPQQLPDEEATSSTVGLLYRPWRPISFYISASDSFSGVPTGIDVYGNLLEKPESGESLEAGIKSSFLGGKLGIDAAVFELDRKNTRRQLTDAEVIAVLGYLPSGARSTQDNGEQSQGFELQVLGRPFPEYQISVTYSYITTELVAPDNPIRNGGPITGRPRANGSLFHKYTFPSRSLKGLSFNNAIVWVDGHRADSISGTTGQVTNYMPGYTRVDFGAAYPARLFGQVFGLAVTVRNATDLKIMEGLQSKGDFRSWRFSVSTKF
jgi:outer membrane receptor protein involved in Fe transport